MKNKNQEVKKPNIKTEGSEQPTSSQAQPNSNVQSNVSDSVLKKELEAKNQKIAQLTKELENYNANFKKEIEIRTAKAQEQLNTKIADVTNRANEEIKTAKKYAIKDHAEELINIISQINSIVKSSENSANQEVRNYVVGFKMYMSMFDNLLANMGIKEIVVKPGDLFDEKIMNAVDTESSSSVKSGHVTKVNRTGYYLHDRVLIHTDVVVAK